MTDPDFSRGGGANYQTGCSNLLFSKTVAENCLKMKEFGPKDATLDPSLNM